MNNLITKSSQSCALSKAAEDVWILVEIWLFVCGWLFVCFLDFLFCLKFPHAGEQPSLALSRLWQPVSSVWKSHQAPKHTLILVPLSFLPKPKPHNSSFSLVRNGVGQGLGFRCFLLQHYKNKPKSLSTKQHEISETLIGVLFVFLFVCFCQFSDRNERVCVGTSNQKQERRKEKPTQTKLFYNLEMALSNTSKALMSSKARSKHCTRRWVGRVSP